METDRLLRANERLRRAASRLRQANTELLDAEREQREAWDEVTAAELDRKRHHSAEGDK